MPRKISRPKVRVSSTVKVTVKVGRQTRTITKRKVRYV